MVNGRERDGIFETDDVIHYVQATRSGEETGSLDHMLHKVADFYDDEVETAVKGLTAILEPVMIVVVGGIVGFIVMAMYMPMFKIYNEIQ